MRGLITWDYDLKSPKIRHKNGGHRSFPPPPYLQICPCRGNAQIKPLRRGSNRCSGGASSGQQDNQRCKWWSEVAQIIRGSLEILGCGQGRREREREQKSFNDPNSPRNSYSVQHGSKSLVSRDRVPVLLMVSVSEVVSWVWRGGILSRYLSLCLSWHTYVQGSFYIYISLSGG